MSVNLNTKPDWFLESTNTVDFSKCDKTEWSKAESVKNIANHVKKANAIILPSGQVVKRRIWKTGFEDCLSWSCQNNKKTEILMQAYEEAFNDYPESVKKDDIRHFIRNNLHFFGTNAYTFDLSNSEIAYLANGDFCKRFEHFQNIVRTKLEAHYTQNKTTSETHKKSIAVLTCNAGGGHKMVAKSIEEYLNKENSYDVKVINVDELPGDTLDVVTAGAVKTYQIYTQFRCQEKNDAKADSFLDLRWELHQFTPSNSLDTINNRLVECNADAVLNTIHHNPNYIACLSDLRIPICYVNTDYLLPGRLVDLNTRFKNKDFTIATPVDYKEAAQNILPVGYPVRSGFEMQISKEQKEELRQKYTVGPDESLIVMQMGNLALGIDREIESLLQQTMNLKKKCHFVLLCSNNPAAKDAVIKAQNSNTNSMVTLHAEGMLSDKELSTLYQASDAVLGKSGGSTTGEIAATGAFLLTYKPFPWERPNLEYLKTRNQAKEIHSFAEIDTFLSQKIETIKKVAPVLDWKSNLMKHVHTVVRATTGTGTVIRPYSASTYDTWKRRIGYIWNSIKESFASAARGVVRALHEIQHTVDVLFKKTMKKKGLLHTI